MSEEKLTPEKVALLEANLFELTDDQKVKALNALRVYKKHAVQEHGAEHFLDFIQHVYPGYIIGGIIENLLKYLKTLLTEKRNALLLTSLRDMGSQSLFLTWHRHGFWVSIHLKKLLWHLILLIWQLTLAVVCVTWWAVTRIKIFFLQ